ncbi:MAG: hypothetical protein ABFD08_04910 [Syntrophomonas sp.]
MMQKIRKEFVTNQQGSKIFTNIDDQPKLAIPVLGDNKIRGVVLEVLSVAFHDNNRTPMVTVRKNKTIKSYLLPDWYKDWAELNIASAHSGATPFPCQIEFGYIPDEERYYAEVL